MPIKIYVAGHSGMVGSAIWRRLSTDKSYTLLGKSSRELDLRNQAAVNAFIEKSRPDIIINAAARVGGIIANRDHPYPFIMENLQIQSNLIDTAIKHRIQKFIFLGSSCIYPKFASQPLHETSILTGPLEPTNIWYAIAKIAGVKACEAIREQYGLPYISLMPTNLYGPNDNFSLETSHVLPAMIRKFHEGVIQGHTTVNLWGSGTPMREFLHVDDLADAVAFAVTKDLPNSIYNVGTGKDITIKKLAEIMQRITGYKGEVSWDRSKPDGTPRKLLDVSALTAAGWKYSIELEEGINSTYKWFVQNRHGFKEIVL